MYDAEEIRRRKGRRAMRRLILFVVLAPIVIGAGAYWFLSRGARLAPVSQPLAAAPTVSPSPGRTPTAVPTPPRTPLPPLDNSDAFVRQLASGLSSQPAFASWLLTDGLIRRFVVVVDNVAEGKTPQKQVPFLAPKGKFETAEKHGTTVIDPKTYARYDTIGDVVASLDTPGSAELYRRMKPLIQAAYRDLGYPDRNFDDTLARAIAVLLKTPVPEGDVGVRSAVKSLKYQDPKLEGLSPAQKQFLRMGPENMRKVKAKLRDLAEALDLPRPK